MKLSGSVLREKITRAMEIGNVASFEVCFEALGSNPHIRTTEGETLWSEWLQIRLSRPHDENNRAIDALFAAHGVGDIEKVVTLYIKGGFVALIEAAKRGTLHINDQNEEGRTGLDLLIDEAFMFGKYRQRSLNEEEVAQLRKVGYRFGWCTEGTNALWRSARQWRRPLAKCWFWRVQDAVALGMHDGLRYRLHDIPQSKIRRYEYFEPRAFAEFDHTPFNPTFKHYNPVQVCLDRGGRMTQAMNLTELLQNDSLVVWGNSSHIMKERILSETNEAEIHAGHVALLREIEIPEVSGYDREECMYEVPEAFL